jgi:hypothetical protein
MLDIDIKKEFDKVNWIFLHLSLTQVGLFEEFITWLEEFFKVVSFYILIMHTCTNEVVHAHSIVLCAPKEMHKEFHRVCIRLGFVSSMPSVNTTKCALVQVLSVASETKKMPTRIKKGIIRKSP